MLNFKSVTIRNFMAFGAVPTTVNLDVKGTTIILGEDLDNTESGVGSNGVGKSTIINAISYALYDKILTVGGTKDEWINNINGKNLEVTVVFMKGNKTYTIRRCRKMKAGADGNFVEIMETVDGKSKDITSAGSGNANDDITKIIGYPHEIFARIVTITASHAPFLELPVRSHYAVNQTDIIEELFDIKAISEKGEALKKEIKAVELSLKTQQEKVKIREEENERHDKLVASARTRVKNWQVSTDSDLVTLQKELTRLSNADLDEQRDVLTSIETTRNTLKEKQAGLRDLKSTTNTAKTEKTTAEREIKHLTDDECPYCLQSFSSESKEDKLKVAHECVDSNTALISGNVDEIATLQGLVDELDKELDSLKSKKEFKSIEDVINATNNIQNINESIKKLNTEENPHKSAYNSLVEAKREDISLDVVNTLTEKIEHMKFLLKLLTKKDSFVRKALLHKNIPFLNARLAHYLSEMGLPHVVEFTHEMTATISRFGRHVSFSNMSTGQRSRVNLALAIAFRDVLQSSHESINICMLDEVLDVGLDSIGVQVAAKMLKRKAREEGMAMFIISHRDEIDGAFDNSLIVQMSKGFSYIKEYKND